MRVDEREEGEEEEKKERKGGWSQKEKVIGA